MKTFCGCLREAIPLLRFQAEAAASNRNGLEGNPRIDFCTSAKRIVGELLKFDEKHIVVRNLDGVTSYNLRDVLEGDGAPTSVELEWVEWFPIGGYYGETREEYGGAPDPLPRCVVRTTIGRQPAGGWQ